MSTVRILALGALLVVGFAGVSAAQSTTTPPTRPDSGLYRRGPRPNGEFRRGPGGREAQKAQIKAIHQKYQPQNQALRTQAQPFFDAARAARQKGDSAAVRSNMDKARQVLQGGQSSRNQEMAEIRAVLTPDQRAKFDARKKEFDERRAKGGHRGWGRKGPAAPAAKS